MNHHSLEWYVIWNSTSKSRNWRAWGGGEKRRKLTSHKYIWYIQYELKRKWLVGGSRGSLLLLALASGCLGGWSCASFYIINWFFDKKKSDVVQWARKWLLFIFGNMVYIYIRKWKKFEDLIKKILVDLIWIQ